MRLIRRELSLSILAFALGFGTAACSTYRSHAPSIGEFKTPSEYQTCADCVQHRIVHNGNVNFYEDTTKNGGKAHLVDLCKTEDVCFTIKGDIQSCIFVDQIFTDLEQPEACDK